MHAIIVGRAWEGVVRITQIFDIEQKQAFSVFEIEEERNATVHGLVLEVSPVKQSMNNPDVKYYIGKDLRWQEGS